MSEEFSNATEETPVQRLLWLIQRWQSVIQLTFAYQCHVDHHKHREAAETAYDEAMEYRQSCGDDDQFQDLYRVFTYQSKQSETALRWLTESRNQMKEIENLVRANFPILLGEVPRIDFCGSCPDDLESRVVEFLTLEGEIRQIVRDSSEPENSQQAESSELSGL